MVGIATCETMKMTLFSQRSFEPLSSPATGQICAEKKMIYVETHLATAC
jgi:hypothetical protein